MAGDRDWSNVSFMPDGKSPVEFGEVGVIFPSRNAHDFAGSEALDPADVIGPIHIRVQSSNISAIPAFPKGQVGMFQGIYLKTRIQYSACNAKVIDSKPGDLLLESKTLDGVTSPVALSVE